MTDMTEYVSHLADDTGLFTTCGEPWQGWQEPGGAPRVGPNMSGPLPPHDEPRGYLDKTRLCGACLQFARLSPAKLREIADRRERQVPSSRLTITDPTGTPALGLTDDPLSALRECLAFSSRDWSQEADLAWLYGIILGWDDPDEPDADATEDVAARFGWDAAKVARLRALRAAFASLR